MLRTVRSMSPVRSARRAVRRRALPGVAPLETRELLTLLGQQLFPSNNPWNQNISAAPVASNSAAIINNIISLYGDGRFHPDFHQDTRGSNPLYGIPFNVVHGNTQPKVHVVVDSYASESDLKDAPIPANAVLEGDNQNGPVAGLANRGDSHLIVWDEDNNVAYEFYHASRPSENADGQWHAAQETVWDMKTNTFRTLGWTSTSASGLAILPGLVRPDEGLPASEGGQGVINHAIFLTLQNNIILDQFIYPASHVANPGNTNAAVQPPIGARFRLKAGVDISTLNPQSRVIAQAMKDYGAIVMDNGANFFASGADYSVDANNNFALTWNDDDIQDSTHGLKSLTFSDFEVVDLTPVVTGLSASSGAAGSTITVTGANFSGAADHLQVFFGNTAATNVTVLDDSHVTAVVPAGTGTVDVRVQSGVTSPDTQNIKDPVFGYGTSAVTPADRWSFTTTAAPPTVPTVANETPAPGATGVATTTSVEATFSEATDPTTINTTTFVLRDASNKIVPATVSYNAATATLQPNAALTAGMTYSATVSGAKDQSGNPMTAPFSWSFTTDPAAPPPPITGGTYNLWGGSAKPTVASDPDTSSVELGVKFSSDAAGSISGIRFYKSAGNTGTHVAHLWSSTGNLLASATYTSETASGWQQVNFAKPVAISANTTYVASYFAPAGRYVDDTGYFSSGYSSGPLHVPANGGVYIYSSQGGYPSQTWQASNYWVDLVLTT